MAYKTNYVFENLSDENNNKKESQAIITCLLYFRYKITKIRKLTNINYSIFLLTSINNSAIQFLIFIIFAFIG